MTRNTDADLANTFDLSCLSDSFYADPYPTYRALLDHAPVKSLPTGGVAMAAGTPVTLCIGAANRDPDRFDIARTPNRHLAFAAGIHPCAGMSLARLEGAVAIARFVARFPQYRLCGTPTRGGRARFRGYLRVPCRLQ